MNKNKILSTVFAVALVILILSSSIALPIYIRPFYYLQIDALGIPERTGMTKDQLWDAYNSLLNYLTIPGCEFDVGDFAYSESGYLHFKDCKSLFILDSVLLVLSACTVITLSVLRKRDKFQLMRPNGKHISYRVAIGLLIGLTTTGLLASIDFNAAFNIFHKLFFPGKGNWIFNYETDPIIRALPKAFFRNCAILILSSVIIQTFTIIVVNIIKGKKNRRD